MRLLVRTLILTVALLIVAQFFAVIVESQIAALLSWYLIYALIVLIPLTVLSEGYSRFDANRS